MAIKRGVTISFKNTKKDVALYNLIMEMDDKSNELKQILYKALVKCEEEIKINKVENKEDVINPLKVFNF